MKSETRENFQVGKVGWMSLHTPLQLLLLNVFIYFDPAVFIIPFSIVN